MIEKFKLHVKECVGNNFVSYIWSDYTRVRGKQTFAIFKGMGIAYDVSKEVYDWGRKICVPINKKYLGQFPDEGSSGILGYYFKNGKDKTLDPYFVHCGWLHTRELDITNEEIEENIMDDIKQGQNVLTDKPAGWV